MDPFGYLSILTSIVLGLGITRLLSGCGELLQLGLSVRLYWVHLLWAGNVFLFLVLNWWILFRWRTQTEWTFFIFLFVLLSPTISYLLTVLLFPRTLGAGSDLRTHYFAQRRGFFLLAALLPPIDAVDTLLKGWDHFAAQGAIYPVTLALVSVLSLIAARTASPRYHAAFGVFFLLYISLFITINLRVLN